MINNTSMPRSWIIPELGYPDVREAVQWLTRTFGFKERVRIGEHRAQLTYGSGDLIVMQGSAVSASTPMTHAVMVRVADLDAHYSHSKQSGAKVTREPKTFPYGERQYSVTDIGGHIWTFSQSVADVDPSTWGGTLNKQAP